MQMQQGGDGALPGDGVAGPVGGEGEAGVSPGSSGDLGGAIAPPRARPALSSTSAMRCSVRSPQPAAACCGSSMWIPRYDPVLSPQPFRGASASSSLHRQRQPQSNNGCPTCGPLQAHAASMEAQLDEARATRNLLLEQHFAEERRHQGLAAQLAQASRQSPCACGSRISVVKSAPVTGCAPSPL